MAIRQTPALARLPNVKKVLSNEKFQQWAMRVNNAHNAGGNVLVAAPAPAPVVPAAPPMTVAAVAADPQPDKIKLFEDWTQRQNWMLASREQKLAAIEELGLLIAPGAPPPNSSEGLSEPAGQPTRLRGFYSGDVKTIEDAFQEYFFGYNGKKAAGAAFEAARHTPGCIIHPAASTEHCKKKHLPLAMARATATQPLANVVNALNSIQKGFDWSLSVVQVAFGELNKEPERRPDSHEIPKSGKILVTAGQLRGKLTDWGLECMFN
jgi:hypothetical protein